MKKDIMFRIQKLATMQPRGEESTLDPQTNECIHGTSERFQNETEKNVEQNIQGLSKSVAKKGELNGPQESSDVTDMQEENSNIITINDANNDVIKGNLSEEDKRLCCEKMIKHGPLIYRHLTMVSTVAKRLYKENVLPEEYVDIIILTQHEKGQTSAAEELWQFFCRDPDKSHHETLYKVLEETNQKELAETLRTGIAETGYPGEDTDTMRWVTPPNLGNLTVDVIVGEMEDGKSIVDIVMALVSNYMTIKLSKLQRKDMSLFVDCLQHELVIEIEEQIELRQLLKKAEKDSCIRRLIYFLQKKKESKLKKLIEILRKRPDTNDLASHVEEAFKKCKDVFCQKRIWTNNYSEYLIQVKLQIKSTSLGLYHMIMAKLRVLRDAVFDWTGIRSDNEKIQEGSVEIYFKVKSHWDLENLQKSVASGLFSQRFRSWLKKQNCVISSSTKFETTLVMLKTFGESEDIPIELTMAHYKEEKETDVGKHGSTTNTESSEVQGKQEEVELPNPDELKDETIIEELSEGKPPTYITIAYMSESIVKTLKETDLTILVTELCQKGVLELKEAEQLVAYIQDSNRDNTDCVLLLNVILLQKEEHHINAFSQILAEKPQTKNLASLMCSILCRCQDVCKKPQQKVIADETIPHSVTHEHLEKEGEVSKPGRLQIKWNVQFGKMFMILQDLQRASAIQRILVIVALICIAVLGVLVMFIFWSLYCDAKQYREHELSLKKIEYEHELLLNTLVIEQDLALEEMMSEGKLSLWQELQELGHKHKLKYQQDLAKIECEHKLEFQKQLKEANDEHINKHRQRAGGIIKH